MLDKDMSAKAENKIQILIMTDKCFTVVWIHGSSEWLTHNRS